jgi:beta-glucosidase
VRRWITHNEPQCFIGLGHQSGVHAPGLKLALAEVLVAGHHALLAHGRAVQAIRQSADQEPLVGYAPVGVVRMPESDDPRDVDAAELAAFSIDSIDCFNNTWWVDPVLKGQYPEDGLELFGKAAPQVRGAEMDTICQPLDFLGLNIYRGEQVRMGHGDRPESVPPPDGQPITAFGWPVTPQALYWGPRLFHERYKLPILITENGMSCLDWPATDGRVHDPQRIDFTTRYLRELRRAIEDEIDVRGYYHWSLMDNFEWAEGYRQRFGLVHVDFPTGTRTPKDSFHWYRETITANGDNL